jgi:hypothetical protein
VTSSSLARCVAGTAQVTFLAAFLVSVPAAFAAAQVPSAQELAGMTASGSYLAARHAGREREASVEASYYRAALRRDPKNTELLARAFLSLLVGGDVDEAAKFAERVMQADKTDKVSRLVIGVQELKHKQYAPARRDLSQSVRGPITDLTATFSRPGASMAAATPRLRWPELTSWPARTGTRSSRICMPA